MDQLTLIDGPNLYNDLCRSLAKTALADAPPELQKRYVRDWFDIDRLVRATMAGSRSSFTLAGPGLGTVIFHSRKAVGKTGTPFGLNGEETPEFWIRQGAPPVDDANDDARPLVQAPS